VNKVPTFIIQDQNEAGQRGQAKACQIRCVRLRPPELVRKEVILMSLAEAPHRPVGVVHAPREVEDRVHYPGTRLNRFADTAK